MPAPKRTRSTATAGDLTDNEDVTNNHRSDAGSTRDQESSPATTPRVTRSNPLRRTASTLPLRNVDTPPGPTTPTRPTLRSARTTPSTSPGISRSASLFGTARPPNYAIPVPPSFAGPSTRSGGGTSTLVRAASTSAIPSLTGRSKQMVMGGGSGPPLVKGSAGGDDSCGGNSGRPYKGKENYRPGEDPLLPTPPASEASRKRVRMTPSSSRTRSPSTASVRSESIAPTFGSDLRTSSSLPSPSPSPSLATSISTLDDSATDGTPTKQRAKQAVPLTPTPPLPDAAEVATHFDDISAWTRATVPSETVKRSAPNAYRVLKHRLRLSPSPDDSANFAIVGRDHEKSVLGAYLSLVSTSDAGMYVSGPPGTGKTALTTAVGRELASQGWQVIEVSVMGLKAQDVWTRLGAELGCKGSEKDVTAHLKAKKTRTFIILDEIDSLLPPPPALPTPATSHVLSKLFSLPLLSSQESTIKLVAISNTLDLTVRTSIVIKGNAMPQVLPFKAYMATDMIAIVNARIAALGDGPEAVKVDAKAVELLCRKVEVQNGDLRMCLGVLTSAAGLAEADWVKKGSSPTALVKVSLPHILKAFSSHNKQLRAAAGTTSTGASNPTVNKIRSVPLNGRLVLVSMLVWSMRTRVGLAGCPAKGASLELLTPSALYATYSYLLNDPSSQIQPLPESDYHDLLNNLETLGLVSLPKVRGNIRVELCARENEVHSGLSLSATVKAVGEQVVAEVYAREEAKVARVCARAQAAVERAEHGLPMEME
ncbi:P-loop containing nucleoside triphosphate hydrolase protein [Cutaneotrichosporon oleaginosum]|uniref:p-loop containing nucleoside triphosphate hydrolase protein n=1 Tax=Cutaneotrichosporon oleaginosum TaxID=879819 RepID=A0A0J0XPD5_9TREE|nr:P-loop containing nucleoside triphosphate hydrolase protein [Cutaneotrichosporon oleaginosum]KLT42970.1 P-loop containing nucleoside triphosphate hydrolase protein [Cutaneotrichosporon oleaginosum]TXT11821.1 hypothetical protein COLE_02231 [Cutaneotrichosporon oleaginosum]